MVLANPLLAPERQSGWDAGFDAVFRAGGSLSVTYYDQTAANLIQFVTLATGSVPTYQNQNVGRVHNTGVEVEGRVSVGSMHLKGQYGYARARVEQLAPNYTGDLHVGDQTLATPKHTAGASLTFAPRKGANVAAGVAYVGRFNEYDYVAFYRCLGNTGPCAPSFRDYILGYPGFVKVNASVSREIGRLVSAFVSVDNLTSNESYELYTINPVMGRITTIGLVFHY